MREACQTIVRSDRRGPRPARSATFDPEFQQKLRRTAFCSPVAASQIKAAWTSAIEEPRCTACGSAAVASIRVEEPMYGGANGALKIAHDMPEDFWEKLK